MGSTKRMPAKAGKTAAKAHHRRADDQAQTQTPASKESDSIPGDEETPGNWKFTSAPVTAADRAKNGRLPGRNLVTWTRPRMAEKLLLHMQYECSRFKVDLPWDHIAHRLHPGSSGGAVSQHLNRIRTALIAEGHLVPPICQKPGSRVVVDHNIRGYIRKFPDSDDTVSVKPITYQDPVDDRKFNLPDAVERVDPPNDGDVDGDHALGGGSTRRRVRARKPPVVKKEPSPNSDDSPGPDHSDDDERSSGQVGHYVKAPRRSQRTSTRPVSYAADDEVNKFSEDFYQDEETFGNQGVKDRDVGDGIQTEQGQQMEYDSGDNQNMIPSQSSQSIAPSQGFGQNVGHGNVHAPKPTRALHPDTIRPSIEDHPQNVYSESPNGYTDDNDPNAMSGRRLRKYVKPHYPEDDSALGYVIADAEEDDMPSEKSLNGRSAGQSGATHALPQENNAVNSHSQPIPVVDLADDIDDDRVPSDGIRIYQDNEDNVSEVYDEDGIPPGGIPCYGDKNFDFEEDVIRARRMRGHQGDQLQPRPQ